VIKNFLSNLSEWRHLIVWVTTDKGVKICVSYCFYVILPRCAITYLFRMCDLTANQRNKRRKTSLKYYFWATFTPAFV